MQAPVIQREGVENAARNVPLRSIAPQMMIAVKRQNLAPSSAGANRFPLPDRLGGAP
ncbi:MAG TPA: hypothetical protein VMR62_36735 [Bryobacteraceae bacterium]|nr:hypothetical protein [Bryobacteraceae bacterium]